MRNLMTRIKDILKPASFGTMVVNGNYFHPMANKKNGLNSPALSEAKYYEICEIIRRGNFR